MVHLPAHRVKLSTVLDEGDNLQSIEQFLRLAQQCAQRGSQKRMIVSLNL